MSENSNEITLREIEQCQESAFKAAGFTDITVKAGKQMDGEIVLVMSFRFPKDIILKG